ncbi:MAG: hypothetical protein ACRDQ6_23230 [Pseudonocardiaceae bacterium]
MSLDVVARHPVALVEFPADDPEQALRFWVGVGSTHSLVERWVSHSSASSKTWPHPPVRRQQCARSTPTQAVTVTIEASVDGSPGS